MKSPDAVNLLIIISTVALAGAVTCWVILTQMGKKK